MPPAFYPKKRSNTMRIKTVFVSSILQETALSIRQAQNVVVDEWDLFESGALQEMLQGHFSVDSFDGGGKLSIRYLTYARFLDMPDQRRLSSQLKRSGYELYNRISFGTIYSRTLPALTFGFTEELRRQMGGTLEEIINTPMPFFKKTNLVVTEVAKHDRNAAALMSKALRR